MRLRHCLVGAVLGLYPLVGAGMAWAQLDPRLVPAFSIWDVKIGEPASLIPDTEVVDIACGTNGGPPSQFIAGFASFAQCPAEPSGLHEVYFANDDEMDYVARALESEYEVFRGGTSIYAHPVIISVLIDAEGIVRGIRVVTDERASLRERRVAVTLGRNLRERFGRWNLECEDIPLQPGENPVGKQFEHQICNGHEDALGQAVRIESSYLRKKGQEALNRETQQINSGYFQSQTRLEVVEAPYVPAKPPA